MGKVMITIALAMMVGVTGAATDFGEHFSDSTLRVDCILAGSDDGVSE